MAQVNQHSQAVVEGIPASFPVPGNMAAQQWLLSGLCQYQVDEL